ncbi:MAG: DNA-directed RNA polymerase subunit omega [Acidobacteriaceae bacterium]
MRSDLIYDALTTVPNRYLLCQLASKATRKFHKPNTRIQETTNEVLSRFGEAQGSAEGVLDPAALAPEIEFRRAA